MRSKTREIMPLLVLAVLLGLVSGDFSRTAARADKVAAPDSTSEPGTLSSPDSAAPGDSLIPVQPSSACLPDSSSAGASAPSADSAAAAPEYLNEVGPLPEADSLPEKEFPQEQVLPPEEALPPVLPGPATDNPRALRYNGIYLSGGTLSRQSRIDELIRLAQGTAIGGFVMDMKDDYGRLSYTSSLPLARQAGANTRRLRDPKALVDKLHENNLIACARLVSFKDSILSSFMDQDSLYPYAVLDSSTRRPWRQHNGEQWVNPYDNRVHDYLLGIIEELVGFGFDQIQLDYVRFPSDGNISRCRYQVVIDSLNKADVVGLFLAKVREKLDERNLSLAVDVFGWVPWLHKHRDYWIGQDYDVIARYADVICPMLYSSHFPGSFKAKYGAKRAYHIIREGTYKGVERKGEASTGVQPYIQGFKLRTPYFGTEYLLDQMRAARESGAVGWIIWNARNDYSATWNALSGSVKQGQ